MAKAPAGHGPGQRYEAEGRDEDGQQPGHAENLDAQDEASAATAQAIHT